MGNGLQGACLSAIVWTDEPSGVIQINALNVPLALEVFDLNIVLQLHGSLRVEVFGERSSCPAGIGFLKRQADAAGGEPWHGFETDAVDCGILSCVLQPSQTILTEQTRFVGQICYDKEGVQTISADHESPLPGQNLRPDNFLKTPVMVGM